MAWQLVYTSAPRLLEAGRSGFGTVARHRQISPLLVSAIERASQFARLPGHDSARVIYCHRIVAVAGGRFHVLSCIRDAGADYTGRTNHLAHHIIVEQREVAALGRRAPSPADVLLGFSWIESWNETPRFLETTDEIVLDKFVVTDPGQWARATGDAKNAWLLANGEASRGAYIIYPRGIDARGLFAESLRLAHDRLWQIPFTTALQPSDEASDFRWIGVESDSTLRTQAESSGRPVLDLTRPNLLPQPDVPANAAIAALPRPSAMSSATAPASAHPASTGSTLHQRKSAPAKSVAPGSPRKRFAPGWLIAGSAALLIGAIGFGVVRPYMIESAVIKNRRGILIKRIADCRVFSPQTAGFISHLNPESLSSADEIVSEIEKAAAALREAHLERMSDCKTGGELKQMGVDLGIEVPAEVQTFADRVRQIVSLNAAPSPPAAPERAAYDAMQLQRAAIESFAKETQAIPAFSLAVNELRQKHERAEAAALLALMHPRDSSVQHLPPTEMTLVEERLVRGKPADALAAKTFAETEKLMRAWNSIRKTRTDRVADDLARALRDSRDVWPEWLLKEAQATLAKSKGGSVPAATVAKSATTLPPVPLYFFSEFTPFEETKFPELESGLTFHLRPSPEASPVPLIDPTGEGKLRRQISDPALFSLKDGGKQIAHETAAERLPKPFVLIARKANGEESFQLWFVNETDKPLLPKAVGGLNRSGNILTLDPIKLGLPGTPRTGMKLRLPTGFSVTAGKVESLAVSDWAVDLGPLRAEIARVARETERQIKAFAPADENDVSVRFKELKKTIADGINRDIDEWAMVERARAERKESDEKKRDALFKATEAKRIQRVTQSRTDFGDESAPLFKQAGGCIKAFCQEATFQGRDPLFTAGAELCILPANANAKDLEKAFRTARREVQSAIRNLVTSEEIGRYRAGLRALAAIITLLAPEMPESKNDRAKLAAQMTAKQEELRRINAHPLLSDDVPPGVYRLSVMASGVEIPLMEIEMLR